MKGKEGGGGGGGGGGHKVPAFKISKSKNDLSMKLSSQKHISFVSIVSLFSYLVCVTSCRYDGIFMKTASKLCKLDI